MKNINESGRSMVEMLGVLAIIGVLTVGAMSTVNYGIESFRVRAVYDLVEETARGVSDLQSWKRCYADESPAATKTKICKNVFDDKCETGTGITDATIKTAWGKLSVSLDNNGSEFHIQVTGVPYGSCNQLLNMDWVNVSLDANQSCSANGNELNFTAY